MLTTFNQTSNEDVEIEWQRIRHSGCVWCQTRCYITYNTEKNYLRNIYYQYLLSYDLVPVILCYDAIEIVQIIIIIFIIRWI